MHEIVKRQLCNRPRGGQLVSLGLNIQAIEKARQEALTSPPPRMGAWTVECGAANPAANRFYGLPAQMH